jgi:hypothetical protein
VGEQHGLRVGQPAEPLAELVGRRRVAPLRVELGDVRAIDAGDLREAVAERADAHGEDAVTGRQRVDDRCLEATRAGRGEHRDIRRRAEERLDALEDATEHLCELRPAVVDHLARAGGADARRQGGRAGDTEVGLESVHGCSLVAS